MIILIVDDYAANRKLLRAQLEVENHTILEAGDGVEALLVLEREPVDSVISDILMPNLDGFGLCRTLRQHPRLDALPFILYTSTYTSTADMQLARNVGASGYLVKPAPVPAIIAALRDATFASAHRIVSDETVVLKQYNAALIAKLEDKNAALQQSVQRLERAQDRIGELNRNLEILVAKRTADLSNANHEVQIARASVEQLTGLLPICISCRQIRGEENRWQSVESYINLLTEAPFVHCLCPTCLAKDKVRPGRPDTNIPERSL